MSGGFFERVYNVVSDIPKGKVATYGQIAKMLGAPKFSQIVGYALHVNPKPGVIPCHRVVNRFGETSSSFAFGGEDKQKELLISEGVIFTKDGNVDMKKCQWRPELLDIE
ncbi:MAG: MGMT family protein [Clostridia bacterium]|nr:MGMT family protein [Clostridia bacterium]